MTASGRELRFWLVVRVIVVTAATITSILLARDWRFLAAFNCVCATIAFAGIIVRRRQDSLSRMFATVWTFASMLVTWNIVDGRTFEDLVVVFVVAVGVGAIFLPRSVSTAPPATHETE